MTAFRKLPKEEYEKKRADYFYQLKLYGKAISMYERILEAEREKPLSEEFKARVWNNIASCYTKLFCYQKAMHAYDCAWNAKEDPVFIERMYLLTGDGAGVSREGKILRNDDGRKAGRMGPGWRREASRRRGTQKR